jgi:3-deoxy-manno-octulosonate cytidylyltransferase (CMP-KDO synthetase)
MRRATGKGGFRFDFPSRWAYVAGVIFASGPRPAPSPKCLVHDERILGVIPARLGSERLPRKPLHPLAGRPLLEWVWRRVSSFPLFDDVVVATDAAEIAAACEGWGARAVLTSTSHESGTSRIGEVVARSEYTGYDVVVNVQGDEPFVEESHVAEAVAQVRSGFDIGTVAAPVGTLEAWQDPAVVKVVRRADGGALYFSRSPIPHQRDGTPTTAALASADYLRHLGIYAYRPAVLRQWLALPATVLESTERLEQLRALAAGLSIGVGVVAAAAGGVDTAADAARAEQRIRAEAGHR